MKATTLYTANTLNKAKTKRHYFNKYILIIVVFFALIFVNHSAYSQGAITATWALTEDQNVTVAGVGASTVSATAETFTGMQAYYASSVQRTSPAGTAGTWPDESVINTSRYVEFSITVNSGYTLTITDISMYSYRNSGSAMHSNINWSNDGFISSNTNFFTSTSLPDPTISEPNVTTSAGLPTITESQSFKIRVYAWYSGGTTGKYNILNNLIITGTTSASCSAPTGQPTGSPTFSSVTAALLTWGTLTLAASADNTVIFCREGTAAGDPTDGTTYTANTDWSSKGTQAGATGWYCVYNGSGSPSVSMTNLAPSTNYFFKAYSYNACSGSPKYYTTSPVTANQATSAAAPTVTTGSASSITTTGTILNGTINAANGAATTIMFDYGTTISYSSTDNAGTNSPTSSSATDVSSSYTIASGLTANTLYHFRIKGVNSAGTTNGDDATFAALSLPPTVGSGSGETNSGFTANWSVPGAQGGEIFTYTVEVSTANEGSFEANIVGGSTVSSISSASTSQAITGLSSSTTYYYRVTAVNAGGSNASDISAGINTLAGSTATDYFRSQTSGDWDAASTWESSVNGTDWGNATLTPTNTSAGITTQNGHVVVVTASVSADDMTIATGGQVTVSSGQTLTIADGAAATDLALNGTLVNSGTVTPTGTLVVENGGLFDHNQSNITIPTITWNTGSTLKLSGTYTGTSISLPAGSYYNIIYQGTVTASGDYVGLGLTNAITIAGKLTASGSGAGALLTSGPGTSTVTVAEYEQTSGNVFINRNSAGDRGLTVSGNATISGGTLYVITLSNIGSGTLTVGGNFTVETGAVVANDATNGSAAIIFNGTTTQIFSNAGNFNYSGSGSSLSITVNSGAIVDLGTSNFGTSDNPITFTTQANATLISAHTSGINGNINVAGTIILDAGTNYEFNGTSAQVTGNELTGANNLTINNSAGVTLSAATPVSGILTLTDGLLTTGANLLSVTNTAVGAITGYSATSYVNGPIQWSMVTGNSYYFPVGDASNYRPFEMNDITCTTPVVRVTNAAAGASTYDGTLTSVAARNWYAQLISGSFTSATIRITEDGLGSANVVAGSSAQSGDYSSIGGNNIGTNISSNTAISYTGSTYFAIGSTYSVNTFSGTGNFSDPARWSGGTLPDSGDDLIIDGTCTVDDNGGTDNVTYGTLTIGTGTGRTLDWAASGTNRLNVSDFSAGAGASTLDMTNGGTLILRGTWTSTNLSFTPGAGTIELQSTLTLPAAYATYNNLTVNGAAETVTAGVNTTVNGDLSVSAGTLDLDSYTVDRGSAGGILTISNGATLKIGSTNTLPADYSTHSIGATSTIEYGGTDQSVGILNSSQDYGNLIISGSGTKALAGTEAVDNDLTIESGTALSISPVSNLTVSGTFTNNADTSGFVLESFATGTASLIHSTAGVAATVQRYMVNDHWHLTSFCASGQSIPYFLNLGANNIPTSGANYGMMAYSESGGGYQFFTAGTSGNLSVGTGYLLRHTTDDAVSSYGTLNTATVNVGITKDAYGWNGIGNPFPCSIGVRDDASTSEDFLTYNAAEFDPSYAVLYLWDEPAVREAGVNYYKVIGNTGFVSAKPVIDQAYLQSGQGFLVKSKIGGGTMSFTTAMRVHESTETFYKSKRDPWPGINLIVSSEEKSASTAITFYKNMTTGLDITYDAGLLGGDPSFKLYSRLIEDNGINFMLQCLPDYDFETMIIPLGFDCKEGGMVTFSAKTTLLPEGCGVILEDRLLGTFTSLEADSVYTASIEENSEGIGRFYIHPYTPEDPTDPEEPISINDNTIPSLHIYSFDGEIIIEGMTINKGRANLFSLAGNLIKTFELIPANVHRLQVDDVPAGLYILKINSKNRNENKKILLH